MVGGQSIYRYDGQADPNTPIWTSITDSNPINFGHGSPGENGRAYYANGKIISAPDNSTMTVYDMASNSWNAYVLPLAAGDSYGWSQPSQLVNQTTGTFYRAYTTLNAGSVDHGCYVTPYDTTTGTFGTSYDGNNAAGQFSFKQECNSTTVFSFNQMGENVQVLMYDTKTQAADFSGTWTASSVFDLGAGVDFVGGDAYGADMMAFDAKTNKLYLVGEYTGITLEYDVATDSWTRLADAPLGSGSYRTEALEVVNGVLYFTNSSYGVFAALNLTPEPATMALLAVGAIGMVIRRRRK
jgi:hypothetical protein